MASAAAPGSLLATESLSDDHGNAQDFFRTVPAPAARVLPPPATTRPPAPTEVAKFAAPALPLIDAVPMMEEDAPDDARFSTFPDRIPRALPEPKGEYKARKLERVVRIKAKFQTGKEFPARFDIGQDLAYHAVNYGRRFIEMDHDAGNLEKSDEEDPKLRIEELFQSLAMTSNPAARERLQTELEQLQLASMRPPETAEQKTRRRQNERHSDAWMRSFMDEGDDSDGSDGYAGYADEGDEGGECGGYDDEGDSRRRATAEEFGSAQFHQNMDDALEQDGPDLRMTHDDEVMHRATGMSIGGVGSYSGKVVFANANGPEGYRCARCQKAAGEDAEEEDNAAVFCSHSSTGQQLDDSDNPVFGPSTKQRHVSVWRQQQMSDAHRLQQLSVEFDMHTHDDPTIRARYGWAFDLDNPEHEKWWLQLDPNVHPDQHPNRVTQKMANLLLAGRHDEVYRRTQVCGRPSCRVAQMLEDPVRYAFWRSSHRKPNLEQATENKDMQSALRTNCMLLRKQYLRHLDETKRGGPKFVPNEHDRLGLTKVQVTALLTHVVDCSQWMQQREKDFLAAADFFIVYAAEIGFNWDDNQWVKESMHRCARNYVNLVVLPHILQAPDAFKDRKDNEADWTAELKKFFGNEYETQPVDCVLSLMRLKYQEQHGNPRVAPHLEDWLGKQALDAVSEAVTGGVRGIDAGPRDDESGPSARQLLRNSAQKRSYIAQRAIFEEMALEDVVGVEQRGRLALTVPSDGKFNPNLLTPEGIYAAVHSILGDGGMHKVDLEYARSARIEKRGVSRLQALRAANRGRISHYDCMSMLRTMGGRGGGRDRTFGTFVCNLSGGRPVFPASGDINHTNNVSVHKRYLTIFRGLGCPDYAELAALRGRNKSDRKRLVRELRAAVKNHDQPTARHLAARLEHLEEEHKRQEDGLITAQERVNSMLQFKPTGNNCCAAVNYLQSKEIGSTKWGHVVRKPETDGNPPEPHEALTLEDRQNGDNAKDRAIARARAMADARKEALDAAIRRETELAYPLGGGASLHRDGLRKAMGLGGLRPRRCNGKGAGRSDLVCELTTVLKGPVVEEPTHVSTLGAPALLGQPKPVPTGDGAFASEEALEFINMKTLRISSELDDEGPSRLNRAVQEQLLDELKQASECLLENEAPPRPPQRSQVYGLMHQSRALPDPLARTNLRTEAVAQAPSGGHAGAPRPLDVESKMADAGPKRKRLAEERKSMEASRILMPPSMPTRKEMVAAFVQTRLTQLELTPTATLARLEETLNMLTLAHPKCIGKLLPAEGPHGGCVSIKKVPPMLRKAGYGLMRYANASLAVREAAGVKVFDAKKKTSEATVVTTALFASWRDGIKAKIDAIESDRRQRKRQLQWLAQQSETTAEPAASKVREAPIYREMLAWARVRCGKLSETRLHQRKELAEWEFRKPEVKFGGRRGQAIRGDWNAFPINGLFATCTGEQLGQLKAWWMLEMRREMADSDIRDEDGVCERMAGRNKALRKAMADPKRYTKDMLLNGKPHLNEAQVDEKDAPTDAAWAPWSLEFKKRGREEREAAD
jgi:hypothetical protein